MAHVVLGLLMLWPQSLYELTKNFQAGVSLFYSASTGSIKRALDRLLTDGHVQIAAAEGPRGKKTYAITNTGRQEFHRWMLADLTGTDYEVAVLARTYFLGLIDSSARPKIAANIEQRILFDLDRLEHLEAQVSTTQIPDGLEDVGKFQLATLQYGLATCRTALTWVKEYLPEH